jgi:hypothetical protein
MPAMFPRNVRIDPIRCGYCGGVVGALTRLTFAALPRAFSPYFYRCDSYRPSADREVAAALSTKSSRSRVDRARRPSHVTRLERVPFEKIFAIYGCIIVSLHHGRPIRLSREGAAGATGNMTPGTGCKRLSPVGKHRASENETAEAVALACGRRGSRFLVPDPGCSGRRPGHQNRAVKGQAD